MNSKILKGFDILNTRDNYLQFDFEDLQLPALYKIFYSTFDIGVGKMSVPGVYLSGINQVAGILEQKIESDLDFILFDFLSIAESKILIKNTYDANDPVSCKYWPIGECDSNKNLVVEVDTDVVYLENTSLFSDNSRYKPVADNIFDFVSKISYFELANIGYGIKSYSELYKNWNEPFWRVGEKR